jgi:hypothetical protein
MKRDLTLPQLPKTDSSGNINQQELVQFLSAIQRILDEKQREDYGANEGTGKTITELKSDVDVINEYLYRPGSIIEQISSPCDGSIVKGLSGEYTFPNVTGGQGVSYTYVDVNGSVLSYKPPEGTKQVVYRFNSQVQWVSAHAIGHFKFFIDSDEVLYARHERSGYYYVDRTTFEWVINIGGTADAKVGRLSSWDSNKTLKMMWRAYNGSNYVTLHHTHYWDGGGGAYLSIPTLTITAIA